MLLTNEIVKESGMFLLETINIPEKYTIISNLAFEKCQAKNIILNDNITEIKHFAFANCSNLEKIIIPNSVKKIGSFVFQNCTSIMVITISKNVVILNDGLFQGCINLEKINILGIIEKIGEDIFRYCFNIENINSNKENTSIINNLIINDISKNKYNFDRKISTCNIYNLIKNIKGIESSSASNTDTWIATFRYKTTYENKPIEKGFLKIFLSDLVYEIQTYEKIMTLYDNNICTNFVKYLNSCINCTSKDLLTLLSGKTILDDKNIVQNLNRNIAYMTNKFKNRPAIDEITLISYRNILDEHKYNILLLEYVEPITFYNWIMENEYTPKFNIELWNIVFQICVGCYSLSLSKILHNDMHMGNIFIKEFPTEITSLYYINGKPIIIKSKYKPLIYDFDRAYTERLGENEFIKGKETYSLKNFYIENKDIIKVFCFIYNVLPMYRKYILDLVSKNKIGRDIIRESYNLSAPHVKKICHLQFKCNEHGIIEPIPNEWYENFCNYEEIIEKIIKKLPPISLDSEDIDKTNIFYCNKSYFYPNGSIDIEKIEIDKRKSILLSYEPARKKFKSDSGRRKSRRKSKRRKKKSKRSKRKNK